MKIEALYVYPVKALRAVSLQHAQVTRHGFPNDRRFMLLHADKDSAGNITYKNIHVAHYPESVHFFPSLDLDANEITITYRPGSDEEQTMRFPLQPSSVSDLDTVDIEMHKSPTTAYKMPQQYSDWFSKCYRKEVVLIYLGPHYRPVLMSSSPNIQTKSTSGGWLSSISSYIPSNPLFSNSENENDGPAEVTFADCAPYLICSSRSMDDIQSRLPNSPAQDIDVLKFRPNILISGADEPWEEDYWSRLTISSSSSSSSSPIDISCIHNCGRCVSINIDYTTGAPGKGESGQLLKKMQKDRRVDKGTKYSPIFGRYSFLAKGSQEGGEVRVGDEVEVTGRNEEHTRFDWKGLST